MTPLLSFVSMVLGATAKFRADQLRYYTGRAKGLESEEKKLHLQTSLEKEKAPAFQGDAQ